MSRDAFLKKAQAVNHSTAAHKRAPIQEAEWAKRGGGVKTPGSGNKSIKGDVQKFRGIVRLECKTTSRNSFSVSRKMVRKLEESALPHGEIPAIVVEFLHENGQPAHELAVVPTYVLDLLGEQNETDS